MLQRKPEAVLLSVKVAALSDPRFTRRGADDGEYTVSGFSLLESGDGRLASLSIHETSIITRIVLTQFFIGVNRFYGR